MKATGEFAIEMAPLEMHLQAAPGINAGRMSIDKKFSGDLVGTSIGEMLSTMTAVEGSAGYVAVEHVTGSLQGKEGSFVLQHFGMMNAGQHRLLLEVVPDSGAGGLKGLRGSMAIVFDGGKHSYEFEYSVP